MRLLCFLLAAIALRAQDAGVTTAWNARESLASLGSQIRRLTPVLEQFQVGEWVARGAPEAYQAQWKAALNEIGYMARTLEALSRQPERATLALEAFLRAQAVEAMVQSLGEGARRYQNPALADVLQGVLSESAPGRDQLRQYLVELTASKEEELRIADAEAQRCRGTLLRKQGASGTPQRK
jgi:hypothetical protein